MSTATKEEQKSIEKILKESRESQGISLEMVHEGTKIPMDVLRAIEEGYTVRTLTPFYRQGFIKIYAKYLNIDIRQYLKQEEVKIEKPEKEKPKVQLPVLNFNLTRILTRKRKEMLGKILGVCILLFLVLKVGGCLLSKISERTSPPEVATTSTSAVKLSRSQQTPASTNNFVTKVNESEISSKKIILSVRATRDSWLQVKSDGTIIFQAVLSKGSAETWDADDKIEISGKNISQLEFELNGKMIGALGRKSRQAKKVYATKEGLFVEGEQ